MIGILDLIALLIGTLTSVLNAVQGESSTSTGPGSPLEKVASEIQTAVEALARVHNEMVTLPELESLRTKKLWP